MSIEEWMIASLASLVPLQETNSHSCRWGEVADTMCQIVSLALLSPLQETNSL